MRRIICAILMLCLLTGVSAAEETVNVLGLQVPKDAEFVDLEGVKLTSVDALCNALAQLPNLKRVDMWKHGLQRPAKAQLHQRFPEVFFGWTVQMNQAHTIRTDMTEYSTLGRSPKLYKDHMVNFTYCPNLIALDVGHNFIKDISFLRDCAKLKILILADAGIEDISPLEEQTEVEYLELFINNITDISPLAKLTKLMDVNLAFNDITDLSPLYDLPNLQRVWLMGNDHLSDEEVERLRQHQPDCEIVTYSWGSTGNRMKKVNGELVQINGTSWRHHPHYDTIYYIFNGGGYIDWDTPIPEDWGKTIWRGAY